MEVSGELHFMGALHWGKEAAWAPQPVWTFWKREKSVASAGIQTPDRAAGNLVAVLTAVSQFDVLASY